MCIRWRVWQLDRTRTECIRISRLKALSDTDSLMLVYDEREQLRLACIKKFVLPVTEKLVTAFKCFLTIEGTHKHQRMRVIVLSNFLVLDMAIFGPSIHGSSTMLRLDHVAGLQDDTFDHGGVSSHSFKLLVVKHRQGESEVQETVWKLAFSKAETCNHARETMSDFEWRARQLRDHMRERPSEDPVMKKIAAKCATYHHLVAGQELVEARNSDSMFLIKSGSVTEAHDKLTFRLLREGSCFGEANFVKGSISTQVCLQHCCSTGHLRSQTLRLDPRRGQCTGVSARKQCSCGHRTSTRTHGEPNRARHESRSALLVHHVQRYPLWACQVPSLDTRLL